MTFKEIQKTWVAKPRIYELTGNSTPPLRQIRSKHKYDNHLTVFDDKENQTRELRFSSTAKSPFVDEQPDKGVRVEHIFFREGYLNTSREQVALQQFLAIHPDNGSIFIELRPDVDAAEEVKDFETLATAFEIVKHLKFDDIEAIMYDEIGDEVFTTSSKELKRDLWVITDNDPEYIIGFADDATITNKFIARKAVKFKIVDIVDDGRTARWTSNKKKIVAIDTDLTPYTALAHFFLTDDGVAVKAKVLEKLKAIE